MKTIPYVSSDAWLLLSIVLAASAEGASLVRIVAIGDAISGALTPLTGVNSMWRFASRASKATSHARRVSACGNASATLLASRVARLFNRAQ